ncbi:hypothetical protein AURDEDRAFT_127152 [Auricularia subglabra TFB-10046 SS5]|uniref:Uncharacterized protein n=1 Tax=Auricularia subglabra (strain TFB-10046 / SS5) TaxID=717982 RepID=J0WYX0_AURST|nr:hypothetical protein AURDEDRAFT_127152 [Auricularia subglabra TFB-10046 SS5]
MGATAPVLAAVASNLSVSQCCQSHCNSGCCAAGSPIRESVAIGGVVLPSRARTQGGEGTRFGSAMARAVSVCAYGSAVGKAGWESRVRGHVRGSLWLYRAHGIRGRWPAKPIAARGAATMVRRLMSRNGTHRVRTEDRGAIGSLGLAIVHANVAEGMFDRASLGDKGAGGGNGRIDKRRRTTTTVLYNGRVFSSGLLLKWLLMGTLL